MAPSCLFRQVFLRQLPSDVWKHSANKKNLLLAELAEEAESYYTSAGIKIAAVRDPTLPRQGTAPAQAHCLSNPDRRPGGNLDRRSVGNLDRRSGGLSRLRSGLFRHSLSRLCCFHHRSGPRATDCEGLPCPMLEN